MLSTLKKAVTWVKKSSRELNTWVKISVQATFYQLLAAFDVAVGELLEVQVRRKLAPWWSGLELWRT